jgi:hypothetical protein
MSLAFYRSERAVITVEDFLMDSALNRDVTRYSGYRSTARLGVIHDGLMAPIP